MLCLFGPTTPRLVLRGWQVDDAEEALTIFDRSEVTRWLSPAMDVVSDLAAMRLVLQQWIAEDARATPPTGRWAIERVDDGRVIGGLILLPLPPGQVELEIGWQLHPDAWGHGFATEATRIVAEWAFSQSVAELFVVVRPGNTRAVATARRNGMTWVGETGKYFGLTLQVYRLRPADLDRSRSRVTGRARPPDEPHSGNAGRAPGIALVEQHTGPTIRAGAPGSGSPCRLGRAARRHHQPIADQPEPVRTAGVVRGLVGPLGFPVGEVLSGDALDVRRRRQIDGGGRALRRRLQEPASTAGRAW